jgi:uncharacterized protein (DUF1697 family)
MACVVFLRGVNVGGHKAFRPSAFARELAAQGLEVINIGAAGTFVVRGGVTPARARDTFRRALPFESEVFSCPGSELLALSAAGFGAGATAEGVTPYVSVLPARVRGTPNLPVLRPGGADWQVKLLEVRGRYVLSLHRRQGRTLIYPNEVVENHFNTPATTRNWNTIAAVCKTLRAS